MKTDDDHNGNFVDSKNDLWDERYLWKDEDPHREIDKIKQEPKPNEEPHISELVDEGDEEPQKIFQMESPVEEEQEDVNEEDDIFEFNKDLFGDFFMDDDK